MAACRGREIVVRHPAVSTPHVLPAAQQPRDESHGEDDCHCGPQHPGDDAHALHSISAVRSGAAVLNDFCL
jgi:hypothetical protein